VWKAETLPIFSSEELWVGGGTYLCIATKRFTYSYFTWCMLHNNNKVQYCKINGTKITFQLFIKNKRIIYFFGSGRISPRSSGSRPGSRGLGGRKNTGDSHSKILLFTRCNPEDSNPVICSSFAAGYVTNLCKKN
jgi:hypothetical protein